MNAQIRPATLAECELGETLCLVVAAVFEGSPRGCNVADDLALAGYTAVGGVRHGESIAKRTCLERGDWSRATTAAIPSSHCKPASVSSVAMWIGTQIS